MKLFEKNVGKTDRIVRFVLGLILFAAGAFYLGSPLAYAAYFLGLILIATGALGTCALYSLLKFTTLEPGEGCKCREGEVCICAPECKICAPKSKEEMDKELREEVPVKAEKTAPFAKEEFSVDIPEEAEEEEKPAFFVPVAPVRAPAPMPKKAKKAPLKKAAPKAKKAKKPAKKKKK
jgi:hypothetical protein